MSMAWAYIEITLEMLIWDLLGLDMDDGRAVTNRLDVRPKTEMLAVLATRYIASPSFHENLKVLLKELADLQTERNLIIHGVWAPSYKGRPVVTTTRRKSGPGVLGGYRISQKELARIVRRTWSAHAALILLAWHVPPLPDRPHARWFGKRPSPPKDPVPKTRPRRKRQHPSSPA